MSDNEDQGYIFPYDFTTLSNAIYYKNRGFWGIMNVQIYSSHYDYFVENWQPFGIQWEPFPWTNIPDIIPKPSIETINEWVGEYLVDAARNWGKAVNDFNSLSIVKKAVRAGASTRSYVPIILTAIPAMLGRIWDADLRYLIEESFRGMYTAMLQVTGDDTLTLADIQELKDFLDSCNLDSYFIDD